MTSTRASLREDLARLGVSAGDLVMPHAGLRSVGRIVGGVNVLIQAILDVIGEQGTVAAYVDFEPFFDENDAPDSVPVFDKRTAQAARDHGILHEALRTWPGAIRSDHPDAGVVAIGPLAEWIVSPHPLQYGYGEGSPFERIVEARGRILMMGAPLDTISMLHHAEHKAHIPNKRVVRYRRLLPGANGPEWVEIEEFDTTQPVNAALPDNVFERIALDFMAAGPAAHGRVGGAETFLFDGAEMVSFAVSWIERAVNV